MALANSLGVTKQTVRNWRERGMPATDSPGGYTYDPGACERWAKENAKYKRHGGRRQRAGRKKQTPPAPLAAEFDAALLADEIAKRDSPPSGAMRIDDLLYLTPDELRTLVQRSDISNLSAAQADLLKGLLDTRRADLRLREIEGSFVPAGEIALTWTKRLAALRRSMESLAADLTPLVLAASNEPFPEHAIRAAITRAVSAAIESLGSE